MTLAGRKILVAGGTGFLGGALIAHLLRAGAQIRATHFSRPPNCKAPGLDWLQADLTQPTACAAACVGADAVFMCAAHTSGAAVITTTPLAHVTPNLVMNARMLEAAHAAGVERFLFLSSGAAYPDLGEDHALAEDDMFRGDPPPVYFPVGWMKRYTEILCRTYAERLADRRMATVIVRPSNVYGPGDKFDFARCHVTAAQIRRVIERHRPIEIWGDGEDVRDLIYVDDFVDGACRAFAVPEPFLVANIAAGRAYSVKEIVGIATHVDGYADPQIRLDPSKPRTIGKRLFDVSFARERLGFTAQTPIETGFAQTIDWYRRTFNQPRPD